jgi:hypothetical protein
MLDARRAGAEKCELDRQVIVVRKAELDLVDVGPAPRVGYSGTWSAETPAVSGYLRRSPGMKLLASTVFLAASAVAPPFAGIPGGTTAPPRTKTSTSPNPNPGGNAATSACSGGKTVSSVPLYGEDVDVGWDETVNGKLVRHRGYPDGWVPDIVYGIRSPTTGKWTIFGWFLLRRIPAGVCLESFRVGPCPTLGLETRALCGKDFAGKSVDRWPGKPEVNAYKLYQRGMSGRRNPAFRDDGTAKMIASDSELEAAWKEWRTRHPG